MRKIILAAFVALASICSQAQDNVAPATVPQTAPAAPSSLKFGYVSYSEMLKAMPEYAVAAQNDSALRASYDAEAKRVENEFNTKYEEFLEGQSTFPASILQKRQTELQQLLDRNIQFKEESKKLLAAAKKEIYATAHSRLASILEKIAIEKGLAFILNTDIDAVSFINPAMGEDITDDVLSAVGSAVAN